MASYELSQAAELDFENIFEFGVDTFGLDQALRYQRDMKQRFDKLAKQARLYPSIAHRLIGPQLPLGRISRHERSVAAPNNGASRPN